MRFRTQTGGSAALGTMASEESVDFAPPRCVLTYGIEQRTNLVSGGWNPGIWEKGGAKELSEGLEFATTRVVVDGLIPSQFLRIRAGAE